MPVSTSPSDVSVRGPLAPGPAVSERRASDVLPSDFPHRGATTWTAALVASVGRTAWLAVVLTTAFVGGAFGATWIRGGSVAAAVPWIVIGSVVWLVAALTWILYRARR